ncbi:hypothetical protein MXB_3877 [Myxobolus squamalis]|nr:hypothetical protein MXB_3877 [Myxobolus squamalis]
MPSNFTLDEKQTSYVQSLAWGLDKSGFTAVLCDTTYEKKPPPYAIIMPKTLPKRLFLTNIVISVIKKSTLWVEKICNKRKNSFFVQNFLLMIDEKKSKFSNSGTVIAMIPESLMKHLSARLLELNNFNC